MSELSLNITVTQASPLSASPRHEARIHSEPQSPTADDHTGRARDASTSTNSSTNSSSRVHASCHSHTPGTRVTDNNALTPRRLAARHPARGHSGNTSQARARNNARQSSVITPRRDLDANSSQRSKSSRRAASSANAHVRKTSGLRSHSPRSPGNTSTTSRDRRRRNSVSGLSEKPSDHSVANTQSQHVENQITHERHFLVHGLRVTTAARALFSAIIDPEDSLRNKPKLNALHKRDKSINLLVSPRAENFVETSQAIVSALDSTQSAAELPADILSLRHILRLSNDDALYQAKRAAYDYILAQYKSEFKLKGSSYVDYLYYTEEQKVTPIDSTTFEQQLSNFQQAVRTLAAGGAAAQATPEVEQPKEAAEPQQAQGLDHVFQRAMASFDTGAPDEAARGLHVLAAAGHLEAQYRLACCYDHGVGVTEDPALAAKYFLLAAIQGHTNAAACIASCYLLGDGLSPDVDRAVSWLQRAADAGSSEAMYVLGCCYAFGTDATAQSWTDAISFFSKATDLKHPEAMCALARCIFDGRDVEQKQPEASPAIDEEEIDFEAIMNTADAPTNENFEDDSDVESTAGFRVEAASSVKPNHERIFSLYRECVEVSSLPAGHVQLGLCFEKGLGTPADLAAAFKNYHAAAVQKHPRGMALVANCFWRGCGVNASRLKAQKIFEKAVACGDRFAEKKLPEVVADVVTFLTPIGGKAAIHAVVISDNKTAAPGKPDTNCFPDSRRLETERKNALLELVSSESLYIHQLELLVEKYLQQIIKLKLANPAAIPVLENAIAILNPIIARHKELDEAMKSSAKGEKDQAVTVLTDYIDDMKMYTKYKEIYVPLLRYLAGGLVPLPLTRFLNQMSHRYGYQSIAQLLNLPLQRVSWYLLLIDQLVKNTPYLNKSIKSFRRALTKLKVVAQELIGPAPAPTQR